MTAQTLGGRGIGAIVCDGLAAVLAQLDAACGGLVATEEALAGPALEPFLHWLDDQAPWSDLPLVVLATRQAAPRSPAASGLLRRLGNVMLLERPVNAETLASAARGALRARARQYQARAFLDERERAATALRRLNETLERRVDLRTAELESARETLAFALDSAAMGSWDLDLLTDTARRSARHDAIFGYDAQQPGWTGATLLSHVLEADRAMVQAAFANAAASGQLAIECRIRRVDGAVRWIAVHGRVEYGPGGVPLRMAGVVMDSTERRETEDALRQAQKMEAIGQLTGGVAHDFNNLLTVIVGGLDLMIRRPEDTARVLRLAGAAMTAARRGEQLTQQLLAFSRRQMLRPEVIDPNRLLTRFEPLAQRAVGGAVTLRLDLGAGVPRILVDPAQFESAVLNLVVNARDAMPDGGTVTIESRAAADGSVTVTVADTGTGFNAATLARAFEPFFTTKEVGKGSGLGLSQVYGFARSASGEVVIDSAPGAGTRVRLRFPAAVGVASAEEEEAAPVATSPATGERVLLVEDDEQVLGMALESLEELRYHVVVARNAAEAMTHLHGPDRFDVLFSDLVMPGGMNGAQLAEAAKRLRPRLKVLLTSGYVGPLAAGPPADIPVLTKPYRRDELARKLRQVLG